MIVIVGFISGLLCGAELVCYFSVPQPYRLQNLCVGMIPFIGGFLLKWKYEMERQP